MGLHELEFMTLAKFDCTTRAEDHAQLTGNVVSSLRGDAMLVAMDTGREKLRGARGLQLLADTLRDRIFQRRAGYFARVGGP